MKRILLSLLLSVLCVFTAYAAGDSYKTIVDMRGKAVKVPTDPMRVATIDDGLVEGVMTHLGVVDRVVSIGSWAMKRDYKYDFETSSGEKYTLRGWHTMKALNPWLDELPCVNSVQGDILNFEAIGLVNPDVMIIRLGDCTMYQADSDKSLKSVKLIEDMGIPVIVLKAPSGNDISTLTKEIEIIGELFGEKDKASQLAHYLFDITDMVRKRTGGVKDKNTVLYLGLNPGARSKGGTGMVSGIDTPESYIIEDVAHAVNAYRGKGSNVLINAEQIYALDPDVIILPTSNGYHPPRELYESGYFENLSQLRAVKNKRVYAMPWSPMNCARRVEYPLDILIIAKAAYPEELKDINVYDFALDFYKFVYNVDDDTAKKLRSEQLLDWMAGTGF